MNRGNNGNNENAFNFSGFGNFFKRQEAAAKAAETRRRQREAAPTRSSARTAAATASTANVNMSAAAAESGWGGEGVPVYGTNYSVARGANENRHNRTSRPARRGRAPARTTGRRNYGNNERRSRVNERSTGYGNNRRNTRRGNNRKIPESEKRESPRHTSILEKAQVVIDKQNESLTNNATKRGYQIKGYENKLELLRKFRREYPGNVNIKVINDAIEILERKLGISRPMEAAAAMRNNRGAAAMSNNTSAAAATVSSTNNTSLPVGLFPKERTIEELLKIRDYMERRAAGPAAAVPRRNRSENFRRFLGMLYASAQYHIAQLHPENDSLDALHLHSGLQFLDELNANAGGVAERPASPEQRAEANAIIDELSGLFSEASI
jgi:hypothetical protein